MKVLVLGGTRFIGKRLVNLLAAAGHEVVVASRGILPVEFVSPIRHIKMDRNSRADMMRIAAEQFDIVYDNVCFTPQEARDAVDAFANQDIRYVMTSSGSVYQPGAALKEDSFAPLKQHISLAESQTLGYDEGKRQAEAVFAQQASFPCVFVRFPIILGEDDYSGRLLFHIRKIADSEPFYLPNPEAKLGFIRCDEAAEFLLWVGTKTTLTGPINAASDGSLTLRQILNIIKDKTGGEIRLSSDADNADYSPFGFSQDFYLNQDYAKSQGFEFLNLSNWLRELVEKVR